MTRLRSCARCGRVHLVTQRCPKTVERDRRTTGWGDRDTARHNIWARAVKERDGLRCAFILEDGTRCPRTWGLHAHHLVPGSEDPADGVTLCLEHHRVLDLHAR